MSDFHSEIVAGLERIQKTFPYYAPLTSAIKLVYEPTVPTMGVDNRFNLYYGDAIVNLCKTRSELDGVLYHECLHLIRGHHIRYSLMISQSLGYVDDLVSKEVWNHAGDIEINPEAKSFFDLPVEAIYPETYKLPAGLTAEAYYALLIKQVGTVQMIAASRGGTKIGLGDLKGLSENLGISAETIVAVHNSIQRKVEQAMQAHKGSARGKSLKTIKPYKVPTPWKTLIKMKLSRIRSLKSGFADTTYSRLSRRSASNLGVITPKWVRSEFGLMVIVVDTSGSTWNYLDRFYSEVWKILRDFPEFKVNIVEIDTEVKQVHEDVKRPPTTPKGCGGTKMEVGEAYVLENYPNCNFLLFLTDGITYWTGSSKLKGKTLVGLLGDIGDPDKWPCPYPKVIIDKRK